MGLPKKKEQGNSVNITPENVGSKRQLDLITKIDPNSAYSFASIRLEDHDLNVNAEFESGQLKTVINGNNVPVIFMPQERWAQFEKTWRFIPGTEGGKNDKVLIPPFITIKRTDTQPGTHNITHYTVPNRMKFTSLLIPHFADGQFKNYYRIQQPQPIAVDLTYEVSFFTQYMQEQNIFDELMLKAFTGRQFYLDIKNHYFALLNQDVTDNSEVEDVESNRIFIKTYQFLLVAYNLDESEIQISETNRSNKTDFGVI